MHKPEEEGCCEVEGELDGAPHFIPHSGQNLALNERIQSHFKYISSYFGRRTAPHDSQYLVPEDTPPDG